MDSDDVRNWAESKSASFTVHDVMYEFDVDKETAWEVLEQMENLEGYRDVAGPRSIDPKTDGVVRDPGIRYKFED